MGSTLRFKIITLSSQLWDWGLLPSFGKREKQLLPAAFSKRKQNHNNLPKKTVWNKEHQRKGKRYKRFAGSRSGKGNREKVPGGTTKVREATRGERLTLNRKKIHSVPLVFRWLEGVWHLHIHERTNICVLLKHCSGCGWGSVFEAVCRNVKLLLYSQIDSLLIPFVSV